MGIPKVTRDVKSEVSKKGIKAKSEFLKKRGGIKAKVELVAKPEKKVSKKVSKE